MDWSFDLDKFGWFILFFLPGFISMKVYGLLVPGERRDFSKDVIEAVAYSALNFAALSWLILIILSKGFYSSHPYWFYFCVIIILLVAPIFWPVLFLRLSKIPLIARYILHPMPRPWDYVFGERKAYWVIVHLKDGKKIAGIYDTKSFASAFPEKEQIYLEEVWKLDDNGVFIEPIKRSAGIIILGEEIVSIEFFN